MSGYALAAVLAVGLMAGAGVAMAGEPLSLPGGGRAFRAGAAAVDISPRKFPVRVSGMFLEGWGQKLQDPLHARCLVLEDGTTRLAIVVVDSLMLPRDLIDAAKEAAAKAAGIAPERMLIAATHTHFAPAAMGALGTDADVEYARQLPGWIAEAIARAAGNLAPARIGWAVVRDSENTHCRRWIFRPDRMGTDPFGGRTVRAMMHPGYQSPNHVGPAGPVDDDLSILSVQSPDGRPLALLANYSQHYCGSPAVSADYFGIFAEKVRELLGAGNAQPPFVGILSQGTSGDQHWMDYSRPARPDKNRHTIAEALAKQAVEACRGIRHHDWLPLAMAETKLSLGRRVPDEKRLAWAREILAKMGDRPARNQQEVYAREQVYLHEAPTCELKLQAIRIGELGITAIPAEVFGITGLKLKALSPLEPTVNMELANGAEGYIPPPEQHALGGYTTWPARSAGLEVQAEPRIVEVVLGLLERVAGKPRRTPSEEPGAYGQAVLASKPLAWWRCGEFGGPRAVDASGNANHGGYEGGVAFYLPGPPGSGFGHAGRGSRAVHFAGGRLVAPAKVLGAAWTVELWFWNGLPADARPNTGYLLSRGPARADAPAEHLAIGGTGLKDAGGKLVFFRGSGVKDAKDVLVGATALQLRTWYHLVLVRDGSDVAVYLNGETKPDLAGRVEPSPAGQEDRLFFAGRSEEGLGLEGKMDEIAVYGRAMPAEEAARHFAAAGTPEKQEDSRPGG